MAYDSVDEPHIIYCITNKVNGKIYVGYTKRPIEQRWDGHVKDSQREGKASYDRVLMTAIRKYGVDSFVIEKIDEAPNAHEAGEKEKFWIKELGAKGKNGYNMTDGGEGVKGWVPSEKDRLRISLQNQGEKNFWWGKYTNQSPHYGKSLSDEHKETLRKNNANNKEVVINGITYQSQAYAAEVLGVSRCSVKDLQNWESRLDKVQHERVKVDGVLYFGVKDAAKKLDTTPYLLKRSGTLTYVDTPWTFDEFLEYARQLKKDIKPVRYCGKVYRSVTALAKKLGRDRDYVRRMVRDGEIEELDEKVYQPSHNAMKIEFSGHVFDSKIQLREYFGISHKEFNRLLASGEIKKVNQ